MVGEKYVLWFAGLLLDMEMKLIHSSSFNVLVLLFLLFFCRTYLSVNFIYIIGLFLTT